jgi:hypothetical protein
LRFRLRLRFWLRLRWRLHLRLNLQSLLGVCCWPVAADTASAAQRAAAATARATLLARSEPNESRRAFHRSRSSRRFRVAADISLVGPHAAKTLH